KMSRESYSCANAPPAPAIMSAKAAMGAAKNRIILFPPQKSIQHISRGHIRRRFASHGPVSTGNPYRLPLPNSHPACRFKPVLAKPSDRGAEQGSNARYCFDENGEQWFIEDAKKVSRGSGLMNGAESLVRTLVAGGVNVCFTNPGTSEMHFVAALDRV